MFNGTIKGHVINSFVVYFVELSHTLVSLKPRLFSSTPLAYCTTGLYYSIFTHTS